MIGVDRLTPIRAARSPLVVNVADAEQRRRTGVAIGFFDGVHLGHRAVIEGCETVLTFDRHPMTVLAPACAPKLLMDLERRIAQIATLGVREVVLISFDRTWASLSAGEFIDRVLVQHLAPQHVSVGENFRFGANAEGTAETVCTRAALPTEVVSLVTDGGQVVSSTQIRALVASGDVEQAGHLMWGALEHTAVRGTDGRLHVDTTLAMPAAGRYQALIDGEVGTVSIGSGSHELFTTHQAADRMTIRFLRRLD
jgi:riboflavin kinase / FMN adenylyltransferase